MDPVAEYGLHTHYCCWCQTSFPCTLMHANATRPRDVCSTCQQRTFAELWAQFQVPHQLVEDN
jgi:hypothetical protein